MKTNQFLKYWKSQKHHKLATLEKRGSNSLYHCDSQTIIYFGRLLPNEKAVVAEQCAFLIEINEEVDEMLTNNILDALLDSEGMIYRSIFC